MRENKQNIVIISGSRGRKIQTDLKALDAHVVRPEEYEDAPEWTEKEFAEATLHIGGVPVKRGRPKAAVTKKAVNLRLSPDVLDYFRSTGPGWQTRIDQALRKAAGLK